MISTYFREEKTTLSTASSLAGEPISSINNLATVSGFVLNLPPTDTAALSFKAKFWCFLHKQAFLEV